VAQAASRTDRRRQPRMEMERKLVLTSLELALRLPF
jgi:hypothetical protein